jgi:hypothetical protein
MRATHVLRDDGLDEAVARALYSAALAWAFDAGDRVVLRVDPSAYDDPAQVDRWRALGGARTVRVEGIPDDLVGRALTSLSRAFGSSDELVEVEAAPSGELRRALEGPAPTAARGGELAPVEDVFVWSGARTLYAAFDYADRQLFDLDDEQVGQVRAALENAGLDPDRLVPQTGGDPR